MNFSFKDFFRKCDQILKKLRIWSHLLKKSLMENFIFCAVFAAIIICRAEACDRAIFQMALFHLGHLKKY